MRRQRNVDAFGTRTLGLTAVILAATWVPQVQADDGARASGPSARLAQTATSALPASKAAEGQDHQNAEMLARELAATKRDLDVLLKLLNKACDPSTHVGQAADERVAELRKSLQQENDRGGGLERDLATARREIETQSALATKAGQEAAQLKQATEKDSVELRQLLQQERNKAETLARELARQASDQAAKLKQAAESGTADLQKSLQQEHDRASGLERDLAAARRDVETQTALATKAGEEAAKLKQATEKDSVELRQSLQQEHNKAETLARELARQASDQAAKLKQESRTADLQKSLQQEHDRASGLERDLAAARRDVETQTALATKAGEEAAQLKQATEKDSVGESSATELRKLLVQEWEREARLQQLLAAAPRDIETRTARGEANDCGSRKRDIQKK